MILNRIFKFIDWINIYFRFIGIICIVVVAIMLFLESIVRLFWSVSLIVVDEFGGLGMYMFVVLSIAPLYRENQHLNTDILIGKFSKKLQHILKMLLHVLTLIFACLATYLWWKFIFIPTYQTARYLQMTRITEWPFHLIAIGGWALLIITAAECLVKEGIYYYE